MQENKNVNRMEEMSLYVNKTFRDQKIEPVREKIRELLEQTEPLTSEQKKVLNEARVEYGASVAELLSNELLIKIDKYIEICKNKPNWCVASHEVITHLGNMITERGFELEAQQEKESEIQGESGSDTDTDDEKEKESDSDTDVPEGECISVITNEQIDKWLKKIEEYPQDKLDIIYNKRIKNYPAYKISGNAKKRKETRESDDKTFSVQTILLPVAETLLGFMQSKGYISMTKAEDIILHWFNVESREDDEKKGQVKDLDRKEVQSMFDVLVSEIGAFILDKKAGVLYLPTSVGSGLKLIDSIKEVNVVLNEGSKVISTSSNSSSSSSSSSISNLPTNPFDRVFMLSAKAAFDPACSDAGTRRLMVKFHLLLPPSHRHFAGQHKLLVDYVARRAVEILEGTEYIEGTKEGGRLELSSPQLFKGLHRDFKKIVKGKKDRYVVVPLEHNPNKLFEIEDVVGPLTSQSNIEGGEMTAFWYFAIMIFARMLIPYHKKSHFHILAAWEIRRDEAKEIYATEFNTLMQPGLTEKLETDDYVWIAKPATLKLIKRFILDKGRRKVVPKKKTIVKSMGPPLTVSTVELEAKKVKKAEKAEESKIDTEDSVPAFLPRPLALSNNIIEKKTEKVDSPLPLPPPLVVIHKSVEKTPPPPPLITPGQPSTLDIDPDKKYDIEPTKETKDSKEERGEKRKPEAVNEDELNPSSPVFDSSCNIGPPKPKRIKLNESFSRVGNPLIINGYTVNAPINKEIELKLCQSSGTCQIPKDALKPYSNDNIITYKCNTPGDKCKCFQNYNTSLFSADVIDYDWICVCGCKPF